MVWSGIHSLLMRTDAKGNASIFDIHVTQIASSRLGHY